MDKFLIRHHEQGCDLWIEMEIHHGHLEFKLKITDVAQSANDGCRPCRSGVVHHETRNRLTFILLICWTEFRISSNRVSIEKRCVFSVLTATTNYSSSNNFAVRVAIEICPL